MTAENSAQNIPASLANLTSSGLFGASAQHVQDYCPQLTNTRGSMPLQVAWARDEDVSMVGIELASCSYSLCALFINPAESHISDEIPRIAALLSLKGY